MPDDCPTPPRKKLYVETVGCQMNVLDSELVVGKLRGEGYELTDDIELADTILYNTCSIRQRSEDKTYSALGKLRRLKERKPSLSIGVLGCMAQKDQGVILRRAPHVDVVIGPGQLGQVSRLLAEAKETGTPRMAVSLPRTGGGRLAVTASFAEYDPLREPAMRPNAFQAYLRIMMGCDKFCTYCIVPSVRGPEQSRPPDDIVAEARILADQGATEITLIGQTVNSYRYQESDGRRTRLSDLLARIDAIEGVRRIKFVTNFPNDMTDDLLQAVRDLPKVSRYLHVPAQSGCDEVLSRMKRMYSVALYDDMLARIRETIPGASVSSDFIVGFCGETEASFRRSVELVERARFKNSYIFKYSPRQGTKADTLFNDDVPELVKKRRNNELLKAQTDICREDNLPFVGTTVEVLVEGPSKMGPDREPGSEFGQLTGRTWCDRVVLFEGHDRLIGQFIDVRVDEAGVVSLFGRVVTTEGVPAGAN
ncbi:tRNA (N6-isopentenyl adenosine(37)-C2)-methylthiotransferase MiaB [Isosphaeraceae bacterium EP7]